MVRYSRTPLAMAVLIGASACVSTDESVGPGEVESPAALAVQPAVIPSAADASALPINRIRAVTARTPSNVVLSDTLITVDPVAAQWTLALHVPLPESPIQAVVLLRLVHEEPDGTRSIQFSGRSETLTLTRGGAVEPADIPLVRGPLANLYVTDVSITSASSVVRGRTLALTADVQTSSTTTPTVYWTSLDTTVISVEGTTATGRALGTAQVVATAGPVSDTVTIDVVPASVATVVVTPDSTDIAVDGSVTYSASVLDDQGNVLSGRVVRWATDNPNVAAVDSITGVVTGASPGTTTVRATSEGVTGTARVRVVGGQQGGALNVWIATGGVWSNDANWSLGRAPIPGDTVDLTQQNDYQITLDVDATVARLSLGGTTDFITLDVGDRTLTLTDQGVDAALDIGAFGNLQVQNGTISVERITNAGTIRVIGFASMASQLIDNTGTTRVAGGVLNFAPPALGGDFRSSNLLALENGGGVIVAPNGNLTYEGGLIQSLNGGSITMGPSTALILEADLALSDIVLLLQGAATVAAGGDRLTIASDAALVLESSPGQAETNTIIDLFGTLQASGPASFLTDSLYVDQGAGVSVIASGAPAWLGTSYVDNAGTIVLAGDDVATFGPGSAAGRAITNRATGLIATSVGGLRVIDGELINQGTVSVLGPTTLRRATVQGAHVAAQHVNTGTIDALDDLTVVLGGAGPSFTNAGTITVQAGGSVAVIDLSNGSFTNDATGLVNGDGQIGVSTGPPTVLNLGRVEPGLSPGVLYWVGDLPMGASGSLGFELGGTTVGIEYDQLNVTGSLTMAGTLAVDTIGGFVPADGDRFAILTFSSRSGSFDAVNLPSLPGLTVDTVWAEAGTTDTLFIEISGGGPAYLNRWVAGGSGLWNVPSNWSLGAVPTGTDSVVIDQTGTYTVTVDTVAAADYLLVGGAGATVTLAHVADTLSVYSDLTVAAGSSYSLSGTARLQGEHTGTFAGPLNWSGGTYAGVAVTTLSSDANTFDGGSKSLQERAIVNEGTVLWSAGLISPSLGSSFVNAAQGTWTIAGDVTMSFGNGVSVTNAGVMTRGTTTGLATIAAAFQNGGSLDIESGTLRLAGSGTHTGGFTVAGGATLDVGSGVHDFQGSITGAGDVLWTGGVSTVSGQFGAPAIIASQSVSFTGTVGALDSIVKTGPNFLTLSTGDTVRTNLLKLAATGSIGGSAPILVLDSLDWTLGTIAGAGGASVVVSPTAAATISGTGVALASAPLRIGGYAGFTSGRFDLLGTALLDVLPGGTFDIRGDLNITGGAPASIVNAGTFVKSLGAGGAPVTPRLTNSGLVDIQTGTLLLGGALTNNDTIEVDAGATLDLDAPATHLPGSFVVGAGTVDVSDMTGGDLSGNVVPGGVAGTATLAWVGDYAPSSTHELRIELSGVQPGLFDQVLIGQQTVAAAFAGLLEVDVIGGYDPQPGDTIPVLVFDERSAPFDAVTLPALPGIQLDTLWSNNAGLANPDTLYLVVSGFPLAFSSARSGSVDVWTQSSDGTRTARLTSSADDEYDPKWSPDGSQLAYTRRLAGTPTVWIMDRDGANQARIVGGATEEADPDWSPLGDRIVYARNDGQTYDIWYMNKDGSGATELTTDAQNNEFQPDWSPNALNIVYVSDAFGSLDIWVTDSIGSYTAQVTFEGTSQIDPQWSPDGSQVVFASDEDGDYEIWVVDVDNSDPGFPQFGTQTQITFNAAFDGEPTWSPDGTRIYYASDITGDLEIWAMDPTGGNRLQITSSAGDDRTPAVKR